MPALGICFGGQVLATAVGGTVSRAPIPEVGWVSVASDEPALIDAGPWLQWHFDRFTLPAEVPVLARTAAANQAFTYGRALGVQFHPEVNEAVLESWLAADDSEQLAAAGIDPPPSSTSRGPWRTGRRRGRTGWSAGSCLTSRAAAGAAAGCPAAPVAAAPR